MSEGVVVFDLIRLDADREGVVAERVITIELALRLLGVDTVQLPRELGPKEDAARRNRRARISSDTGQTIHLDCGERRPVILGRSIPRRVSDDRLGVKIRGPLAVNLRRVRRGFLRSLIPIITERLTKRTDEAGKIRGSSFIIAVGQTHPVLATDVPINLGQLGLLRRERTRRASEGANIVADRLGPRDNRVNLRLIREGEGRGRRRGLAAKVIEIQIKEEAIANDGATEAIVKSPLLEELTLTKECGNRVGVFRASILIGVLVFRGPVKSIRAALSNRIDQHAGKTRATNVERRQLDIDGLQGLQRHRAAQRVRAVAF